MKKTGVFSGYPRGNVCLCVFGLPIHVIDNDRGVMKESQLIKYILRKIANNFAITARTLLLGYNSTPTGLLRGTEPEKRVKLAEATNLKQGLLLIKYIPDLFPEFIRRFQDYFCAWRTTTNLSSKGVGYPSIHCGEPSKGVGHLPDTRRRTVKGGWMPSRRASADCQRGLDTFPTRVGRPSKGVGRL
jgi:hypothetical protein